MRVLVLCEYESLNGGERSLLEAVRRLLDQLEILVAAPARGPLSDALRRCGIGHIPLQLRDAAGRRLPRAELRQELAGLVRTERPDIVHANSLSMSRLAGPVLRNVGVPSIGHLRDIIRISRASAADLNCHTRLLAVSEATRGWYAQLGVSESKIQIAYNGVDLDRFRPRPGQDALRRSLGLPTSTRLVTSIGQLGMRKGVDIYVQAAAHLAEMHQNVHFVFVGQRYSQKGEAVEYERQVLRSAQAGALAGRFHFLGVREDIHLVLNESTIYVHAARQEPLGRVLLEAGASAVPIVATRVGGTQEIFPEQLDAALLVSVDSVDALAAAIDSCLRDPERCRRMAQRARDRIASRFDAAQAASQLNGWYRSLHAM